jgi:biotin synthase
LTTNRELIDRLESEHTLNSEDWIQLFSTYTVEDRVYASDKARALSQKIFGKNIFFRGIVEFTNHCKNDCIYCGIRKSNTALSRYRLSKEDILECCRQGYLHGFRTFVLQGGEDQYFSDDIMTDLIHSIKSSYPDCAITLSIGERSRESYERMFKAGADRYLLRHETANLEHYMRLHPSELSLINRLYCLRVLKQIGYQTGCGMMIGSPYQRDSDLAEDMIYMKAFSPQMIGIGPFIPHSATPFRNFPAGSEEKTLFVLSLVRLMLPEVLLPATTALGTIRNDGRKLGVLSGCNVIMPNLSPLSVRSKYLLYNGKAGVEDDVESSVNILRKQMDEIGYNVVVSRGDWKGSNNND